MRRFVRTTALILASQVATACSSTYLAPPSAVPASQQAARASGSAPYSKGLLALYSFNGTLKDSSGNGHTATDSGTPTYVKGAPFGGKAIAFDGSGTAIVSAPLDISVATIPQLSMGGWFKSTSIAYSRYGVVSNDDGDYDRTLDIDDRDKGGGIKWSAFIGGSVVGKVPVVTGKWVFAAVTYDQSTLPGKYAFYVRHGKKMKVLRGADNFDGDSITTSVTIGSNPNFDEPFAGDAANVFFYVGILTKKQMKDIAAHGPSHIP